MTMIAMVVQAICSGQRQRPSVMRLEADGYRFWTKSGTGQAGPVDRVQDITAYAAISRRSVFTTRLLAVA